MFLKWEGADCGLSIFSPAKLTENVNLALVFFLIAKYIGDSKANAFLATRKPLATVAENFLWMGTVVRSPMNLASSQTYEFKKSRQFGRRGNL